MDANKKPAEVWSAIEKVVGKAPGTAAAKPAAVTKPAAAAKVNEAFVFIKPHANNKAVQDLVRSKFGEKGIEIVRILNDVVVLSKGNRLVLDAVEILGQP